MNQQKAKALRRMVRKSANRIIQDSIQETCRQPLKTRLFVAWRILIAAYK